MNADEIVRALRKAQEDYKNDIVSTGRIRIDAMAGDCADIIESLQAQLAASQRRAQYARNELCLKCGRYRESHNGACAGCRWRGRHQKCSCCRRNRSMRDLWEEAAVDGNV